jgi:hypothetical protein
VAAGLRERQRAGELYLSEIITLLIGFHQSHYRDFKSYYQKHVWVHQRAEFPNLVNYQSFVALTPGALIPLCAYLSSLFGTCTGTGMSFIDATQLAVCHNARIKQHKVFDGLARRGKSSMGWFLASNETSRWGCIWCSMTEVSCWTSSSLMGTFTTSRRSKACRTSQ